MPTIVKDTNGCEYKLTAHRIEEVTDGYPQAGRWVTFKNLRKYCPSRGGDPIDTNDHRNYNVLMTPNYGGESTWFGLTNTGRLSIGCVHFGVEATRTILKAAGIRMGRARTRAKARAKASKRR